MGLFYPEFDAMTQDVWPEATRFLAEFLAAGRREEPRPGPALMDWQQDAPLIAAGIGRAAGAGCAHAPYLHWWSFLALFDAIGEGSFATVVAIRDKLRRGDGWKTGSWIFTAPTAPWWNCAPGGHRRGAG